MAHVTTLRLSEELFEQIKPVIRRRNMSFNAYIEDTIRRALQEEQDREMFEAGTILGMDADSEVDFAFAAQAEVVMKERDDGR